MDTTSPPSLWTVHSGLALWRVRDRIIDNWSLGVLRGRESASQILPCSSYRISTNHTNRVSCMSPSSWLLQFQNGWFQLSCASNIESCCSFGNNLDLLIKHILKQTTSSLGTLLAITTARETESLSPPTDPTPRVRPWNYHTEKTYQCLKERLCIEEQWGLLLESLTVAGRLMVQGSSKRLFP